MNNSLQCPQPLPLLGIEGRHGKGPRDPSRVTEGDLPLVPVINEDVGYGDPEQELLALDPGEPPHPAVLDEGRDLRVVRHRAPDRTETVLLPLALLQPHEPSGAIVAHLHQVIQGQEALGEVDLGEQLRRLLLAERGSGVDFGMVAVVRYQLGRHFFSSDSRGPE